ncbi:type II toxin-antitoxin system toxin DNA ADP-ribosyl transferase DarT [Laribacter hongkongensis]|uniref:DUF4433 domain-containing protein n=1 Tax=Laribacter hongkongensis TaxID=168471 RepID=A0ABD4SX24_9NEIS|nr:DUF4433 domain-containing protein [Laribacter hongkongensis]MCG9027364.1 DUF4433 domain-containing protein [Laribacter hongkongensis]MCG9057238.1 DUF4433 domain-containing protein [Laribacter hongkongensis]
MHIDLNKIRLFHITDISNLPSIVSNGGIFSDAAMRIAHADHSVIGYGDIKDRRLNQITVSCCDNRYVGEFVPFYYCPRSPMLYTINMGNTGRQPGCQKDIVHLVTTAIAGMSTGRDWAISDGNAGAFYTSFYNSPDSLINLNWEVINSNDWGGNRRNQKSSEFLVAEYFPWSEIKGIGCYNQEALERVKSAIANSPHNVPVRVLSDWYY